MLTTTLERSPAPITADTHEYGLITKTADGDVINDRVSGEVETTSPLLEELRISILSIPDSTTPVPPDVRMREPRGPAFEDSLVERRYTAPYTRKPEQPHRNSIRGFRTFNSQTLDAPSGVLAVTSALEQRLLTDVDPIGVVGDEYAGHLAAMHWIARNSLEVATRPAWRFSRERGSEQRTAELGSITISRDVELLGDEGADALTQNVQVVADPTIGPLVQAAISEAETYYLTTARWQSGPLGGIRAAHKLIELQKKKQERDPATYTEFIGTVAKLMVVEIWRQMIRAELERHAPKPAVAVAA